MSKLSSSSMRRRARRGVVYALLALASSISQAGTAQLRANQPAIPEILEAFKTYEVVAMPAAHGEKEIDDLILSLIRDPRFPKLVNDIVVECGNVRYQPSPCDQPLTNRCSRSSDRLEQDTLLRRPQAVFRQGWQHRFRDGERSPSTGRRSCCLESFICCTEAGLAIRDHERVYQQ